MSNEAEDYAYWMGEGPFDVYRQPMDDELPAGVTASTSARLYLTEHLSIAWTESHLYRDPWWAIFRRGAPFATSQHLESARHAKLEDALRDALALEAEHDVLELHQNACYPPQGARVGDVETFLATTWPARRRRVHGFDSVPTAHYWMRILPDGTLTRWRENFDSA